MKRFMLLYNVGKSKYVVSFHDGVKTHDDGSAFYDIRIFKSKHALYSFVAQLRHLGYRDGVA